MEKKKDNAEQDCMNRTSGTLGLERMHTSALEGMQSSTEAASYGMEYGMEYDDDALMSQSYIHEEEMEDEIDEDDSDTPISNQYLHTEISADMTSAPVTSTLA